MELLYLNEGDVTELLDMPGALSVVEDAFLEHGMDRVQMPPRSQVSRSSMCTPATQRLDYPL